MKVTKAWALKDTETGAMEVYTDITLDQAKVCAANCPFPVTIVRVEVREVGAKPKRGAK